LIVAATSPTDAWTVFSIAEFVWAAARVILAVHWLVLMAKTIVLTVATICRTPQKRLNTDENFSNHGNNWQMACLIWKRLQDVSKWFYDIWK
jgi:hypothetical protein